MIFVLITRVKSANLFSLISLTTLVAGGGPPELDQPGLALVERQAELLQPVLEVREELLPIRLELTAEQTRNGGPATQTRLLALRLRAVSSTVSVTGRDVHPNIRRAFSDETGRRFPNSNSRPRTIGSNSATIRATKSGT